MTSQRGLCLAQYRKICFLVGIVLLLVSAEKTFGSCHVDLFPTVELFCTTGTPTQLIKETQVFDDAQITDKAQCMNKGMDLAKAICCSTKDTYKDVNWDIGMEKDGTFMVALKIKFIKIEIQSITKSTPTAQPVIENKTQQCPSFSCLP